MTCVLVTEATQFPGWAAVPPVAGAALLIAAGESSVFNRMVLAHPLFVAVGRISYPLYLWHWPLLVFPTIVYGQELPVGARIGALAATIVLSVLTYRLVEQPMQKARLMPTASNSAIAVVILCCGGVGLLATHGLPARPNISPYTDAAAHMAELQAWPYAENDNCLERYPSQDRRTNWWFCILTNDAPPTVLLLGNSFANHLYPGIVSAPQFAGDNVLQFGACDPAIGVTFSYAQGHPCYAGRQRQEAVLSKIIAEEETVRLAILSAAWPRFNEAGEAVDYFDERKPDGAYTTVPPVSGETSYDAFMAGLERRVAELDARGIATMLLLSPPFMPYDLATCFAARPFGPSSNDCQLPRAPEMERQARFREGVAGIQDRHPSLMVFDPLDVFCDNDVCTMKDADSPFLRDYGHLSVAGSVKLGAAIGRAISERVSAGAGT